MPAKHGPYNLPSYHIHLLNYHNPIMTSIQVTREYIQDPTEFYSLKLVGKDPIKEDIEQQISESLSSPNLNSYTLNIKEPQEDHEAQAVIFHNRSSHQRLGVCHCRVNLTLFQDAREAIRLLQEQVHRLEEKEKERERKEEEMLEWEVFSRIAQGICVLSELEITH